MADNRIIVEYDGERYVQLHGVWYNARTYIKPPEIISRRLDERFGTAQAATTKPTPPAPRPRPAR
jgi:hypothetical protein